MRVNIVNPYNSHAMQRMIIPLDDLSKLYEVTKSEAPDPSADVNIHFPWHTMADYEGGKNIIAYTHMNPPDAPLLYKACEKADYITCMSFEGRRELINLGVDPKKLHVIYAAADPFVFKKKTIGIVGSIQPNGRKRESLLIDLAWQYDLSPYQFAFIGYGWEETVQKLEALGVSAITGTALDGDLQKIYQQFDALLVTGYVEGGSLPILEAMAIGLPVISPKFGYAADLLDEHYSTPEELMNILDAMIDRSSVNHQLVKSWTWRDYAEQYAILIGRLFNSTAEIYPERGADRYEQLIKVIDEIKPKSIVEIGTWSGSRAVQMIQAAAKYRPIEEIFYQGFDLFESMTGEHFRRELSKRALPLEVVSKRIKATGAGFDLVKGDTRETLTNIMLADFYFIDGGHSEETIKSDWQRVQSIIFEGDTVIFDDYYYEGKPDGVGCNQVIESLSNNFKVTRLPIITRSSDGRIIGMVRVERNA